MKKTTRRGFLKLARTDGAIDFGTNAKGEVTITVTCGQDEHVETVNPAGKGFGRMFRLAVIRGTGMDRPSLREQKLAAARRADLDEKAAELRRAVGERKLTEYAAELKKKTAGTARPPKIKKPGGKSKGKAAAARSRVG